MRKCNARGGIARAARNLSCGNNIVVWKIARLRRPWGNLVSQRQKRLNTKELSMGYASVSRGALAESGKTMLVR